MQPRTSTAKFDTALRHIFTSTGFLIGFQVRTLVPLLPSGMEMEEDEIFKLTSKDGNISVEKETVMGTGRRPSEAASKK